MYTVADYSKEEETVHLFQAMLSNAIHHKIIAFVGQQVDNRK